MSSASQDLLDLCLSHFSIFFVPLNLETLLHSLEKRSNSNIFTCHYVHLHPRKLALCFHIWAVFLPSP